MPIACNSNGFQIAELGMNFAVGLGSSSISGLNPLSLALYGIFLFSCLGAVLLLFLVIGKSISMKWDWFSMIGVIASTAIAIYRCSRGGFNIKIFQSGAYVMLIGIIIALIFICMTNTKNKT